MILDTTFYVEERDCEDEACSFTNYLLSVGSYYYVALSTAFPKWEIGDTPTLRLQVNCEPVSALEPAPAIWEEVYPYGIPHVIWICNEDKP